MQRKWILLFAALASLLLLAPGCLWQRTPEPVIVKESPKATVSITVYYVRMLSATEAEMVAEQHEVPKTSNMPLIALQELIRGQVKTSNAYPMIPKDTKVKSLKIDKNGLATVNFSKEVLDNTAVNAVAERYGIASIVATLTQFPEIKQVRLQVEGKETGSIDGMSIDEWWGFGGIKKQPFKM